MGSFEVLQETFKRGKTLQYSYSKEWGQVDVVLVRMGWVFSPVRKFRVVEVTEGKFTITELKKESEAKEMYERLLFAKKV